MADAKISELPISSIVGSDIIPFTNVSASVTSGTTFTDFATLFPTRMVTSVFVSMTAVWFKPSTLVAVDVEAWGGGGSGGLIGNLTGAASGGGGGAYVRAFFTASQIPTAVSITAASSVAGVKSGASILVGNNGNHTIFGDFFTAYGGQRGSVTITTDTLPGADGGSILSGVSQFYSAGGLRSSVASNAVYSSGSGGMVRASAFGSGKTIYGGGAGSSVDWSAAGIGNMAVGAAGISLFGGDGGQSSITATASITAGNGVTPGGGGGGAIGSSMVSGTGADGQVNLYMYLSS